MTFDQTFVFSGNERWSVGWANPNFAGAFIATISCLLWSFDGRRLSWVLLLIEVSLYWIIAKTYSRGALVGILAGALFYVTASGGKKMWLQRQQWVIRALVLCVILVTTGFVSRLDPSAVVSDRAVTHRIELWSAGIKMIAAAPTVGWGAGESGRSFMNWYQSDSHNERFTTMVNSYLTVAVEYGLIAIGIVVFIIIVTLRVVWTAARGGKTLAAGIGASLTAWASTNCFSTLCYDRRLWIVPSIEIAVVAVCILSKANKMKGYLMLLLFGALPSILLVGTLGIAARMLVKKANAATVLCVAPNLVKVGPSSLACRSVIGWEVWPDTRVLGPYPGKECRRWLSAASGALELTVHFPAQDSEATFGPLKSNVMLFGEQAARWHEDGALRGFRLWFVHPTVAPNESSVTFGDGDHVTVVLPEIDETGLDESWRTWAATKHAHIIRSRSSGVDIRPSWPAVVVDGTIL